MNNGCGFKLSRLLPSCYLHFFWGFVKNIVLCPNTQVQDIDDLRRCFHDAITPVTEEMLKNTWGEMKWHLDFIAEKGGRQSKPYWKYEIINHSEKYFLHIT